ncbi:site-specific DNA-methyltransferase [Nocardioides cavernae]|uniref:Site-specific DNA-methyltransferase n=1 Tax=Nocardioides cavernae TaxID=1921566 RepID=A0ABR8NFQ9_9ACTN|nr:site-specific DNA-methyltransferase [Nocardioides cavernae]MBD3926091.1 site-specific DNA-methyltransferase [Nocardioides cavernae]MBM7513680.1 adenine-specific DNA-methyltransferase [Nocardioides cavernae]
MSRLNDLLRQLEANEKTAAIAKELRTEYDALADRRAFGLNFERHTPETVELPGRPVRRGDKVHVLPERGKNPTQENSRLWRVIAIDRATGVATIEDSSTEPAETQEQPATELVVVAEFRDPIYPGLASTGKVERGGDKPFHTVINAENYHALQTLLFTHRSQVDCIYIDPPYNTGNEGWIYSDKYVAGDDHYKHSKWLAFMERRLLLAKELLKPTGVIIVAIGDEEHHRLRMLMDQVFEAQNFISDVVWQGGRKNDSRYVSNGADYMLVYARDESALATADVQWSDRKQGVDDALLAASTAWAEADGNATLATTAFRSWIRSNRGRLTDGVARYNAIDSAGRVFFAGDLSSPNPRPNLRYDLVHPHTGLPVKMNPNGWRTSREAMDKLLADDRVLFGVDHTSTAYYKRFLSDQTQETVGSVFERDRRASGLHLKKVLGEGRFPNPKDHEVIARWLRIAGHADDVVLDFFGGSGTTAEAVMRLNEEDGGTRRCILVTNNEAAAADAKKLRKAGHRPGDQEWEKKGVYEYVTKPRISTVATGVRPDGSTYSEGLEQNVEFFDLRYEAPLRVSSNREFAKVAPLLWMRAGSQGRRIDDVSAGFEVADTYGVLADLDQTEPFLKALAEREASGAEIRVAFVVTDDDRLFTSVCRDLPEHVEAVRLYEAYLRNFEIEAGRSAR